MAEDEEADQPRHRASGSDGPRVDGSRQRLLGHAVYGRAVLALYDALVLGATNRFVWGCPKEAMLELYRTHVSTDHLDVGVGSGFFLDRITFPAPPRLTLLDLSAASLAHAGSRLERYRPRLVPADVLRRIPLPSRSFDSVGLGYVVHCLPGPMTRKAVAFNNLAPLLRPGGVVFGSTVLGRDAGHSRSARALLALYNAVGAFDNRADSAADLEMALAARFDGVRVEVVGSVALFSARNRPLPGPPTAR